MGLMGWEKVTGAKEGGASCESMPAAGSIWFDFPEVAHPAEANNRQQDTPIAVKRAIDLLSAAFIPYSKYKKYIQSSRCVTISH